RERTRGSKLIIKMDGTQTVITDPASGQDKKFAFDYSYWSHDGFTEQANGYFAPASAKYADQQKVFNDLGRGVLDNAWEGYNCSLFAYGQTGSGKSYSMIGYQANKGIVPIACEDLFKAIEAKKPEMKAGEEYQVSLSMIEIYNEQVRDLLVSKTVKGGLKIRQHPNKKTLDGSGQSMTRSSVMNLVDLAGSERADSTGATGDRLKEGSAINQSLSTLGNCIKALADQSTGNSKVVVPFRDSVLTKLLQNALGGNSKTVMIAALSPADINFEETLSTLRFADRAKAIKTKAVVNESPTDKLIRELREENQRLMEMLKSGGGEAVSSSGSGGGDGEGSEEAEERMRELMKRNQEEMEAMERQWAEKLAQAQAESQAQIRDKEAVGERRKQQPHLWNLNEDPSLSGLIVHFCEPGSHTIGREAEFQLRGISILPQHATLNNSSDKVTLTPQNGAKVCVNGREVVQETLLNHHDRVLFGNNHLYVFDNPKAAAPSPSPIPTFEAAQAELAENSGVMGLLGDKAKSSSAG
uniref:Kinesin-like protein n=1 Tax=Macrostomum lignano TaxID=282301 RepID=A0A1I8GX08_9PLAT